MLLDGWLQKSASIPPMIVFFLFESSIEQLLEKDIVLELKVILVKRNRYRETSRW